MTSLGKQDSFPLKKTRFVGWKGSYQSSPWLRKVGEFSSAGSTRWHGVAMSSGPEAKLSQHLEDLRSSKTRVLWGTEAQENHSEGLSKAVQTRWCRPNKSLGHWKEYDGKHQKDIQGRKITLKKHRKQLAIFHLPTVFFSPKKGEGEVPSSVLLKFLRWSRQSKRI